MSLPCLIPARGLHFHMAQNPRGTLPLPPCQAPFPPPPPPVLQPHWLPRWALGASSDIARVFPSAWDLAYVAWLSPITEASAQRGLCCRLSVATCLGNLVQSSLLSLSSPPGQMRELDYRGQQSFPVKGQVSMILGLAACVIVSDCSMLPLLSHGSHRRDGNK